jgi:hypothetical protein
LARKIVIAVVISAVLIGAFLGYSFLSPHFPGPMESYSVAPTGIEANSNKTPIINIPETSDWAGITLHKVSLVVNQQYQNNVPNWYSHFVGDSTLRLLSKLGIEIVDKPPYDATITINVTGEAISSAYNPSGQQEDGGITYAPTSASATVWVSIGSENRQSLEFNHSYTTAPLLRIVGDFPLSKTPINDPIARALVTCLARSWGEGVILAALEDSDELITYAGAHLVYSHCSKTYDANMGNWDGFFTSAHGSWDTISPNVLSALANAYAHGSHSLSYIAFDALEKVTGGYLDDHFPNLLPILTPEILGALDPGTSSALNLDSQGNIVSIKEEAIPSFVKLFNNENEAIRFAASQALSKMGSKAVPPLISALENSSVVERVLIADTLGYIGPDAMDAVPALIESMSNSTFYYSEDSSIASALNKITYSLNSGHYIGNDYTSWHEWWNKRILIQEQIRDAVLNYAKISHSEIASYMRNLNWTDGRANSGFLSQNYYTCLSLGWNVSIQPSEVDSNTIYLVKANYAQNGISVFLQSTYQFGAVTETIYINNQLPLPEQVRNDIVNFLRTHADATPYLQTFDWTGGNITPDGLVSSSTYSYISNGWNVTMQYPIIPNPLYSITANYNQGPFNIAWGGTWQNGNTIEITYTNNRRTIPEEIINLAVNYLRTNHPETVPYLQSFEWIQLDSGSPQIYQNKGWNMTIEYKALDTWGANSEYRISANWKSPTNLSQTIIAWSGTHTDAYRQPPITETSYSYKP